MKYHEIPPNQTFIAWIALVTWYTYCKLVCTKILQNFWLILVFYIVRISTQKLVYIICTGVIVFVWLILGDEPAQSWNLRKWRTLQEIQSCHFIPYQEKFQKYFDQWKNFFAHLSKLYNKVKISKWNLDESGSIKKYYEASLNTLKCIFDKTLPSILHANQKKNYKASLNISMNCFWQNRMIQLQCFS